MTSRNYHVPADLGPLYRFDGNLVADVMRETVLVTTDATGATSERRTIERTGKRAVALGPVKGSK